MTAWEYLAGHPRLQWVPPVWRTQANLHHAGTVVRAVERNLVVRVDGHPGELRISLRTGPLHDLHHNGVVDPVTPAMELDERLEGSGPTFEEALTALAESVCSVYDDGEIRFKGSAVDA